MQPSTGNNWLQSGQAIAVRHAGHGSIQPLTPLRPFWGHLPHHRGYDIRPVRTDHQHGMASALVRRMYSWRGYETTIAGFRPNDAHRVTLAAWQFDEVVATLTLGRDSASGLLADALYTNELDSLRGTGRVVCEVTKLAIDPDFSSKELLTSLFRAAHSYGCEHFAASDAVMEVNPRHVRYYERWFGFRQIGQLRHCERVAAPAILLHQKMEGFAIPTCANAGVRDVVSLPARPAARASLM